MQVHSAQTNKKNLCLRFWVSPSLASVSFLAKLAWLIIVFFLIKMVNAALWTLLKTAKTVLVGSLWCSPVALELCCGGSTLGGGRDFAILRSSSRDFCALAFGPQRNVCHWPAHCESLFFILHLFLIFMNLVTMQQSSVVNWLCLVQLSFTT